MPAAAEEKCVVSKAAGVLGIGVNRSRIIFLRGIYVLALLFKEIPIVPEVPGTFGIGVNRLSVKYFCNVKVTIPFEGDRVVS